MEAQAGFLNLQAVPIDNFLIDGIAIFQHTDNIRENPDEHLFLYCADPDASNKQPARSRVRLSPPIAPLAVFSSDSENDVDCDESCLIPPIFYFSSSPADESLATRCRSSNLSFLEQIPLAMLDLELLARLLAVPVSCRTVGQSTDGQPTGQHAAKHRFHSGR